MSWFFLGFSIFIIKGVKKGKQEIRFIAAMANSKAVFNKAESEARVIYDKAIAEAELRARAVYAKAESEDEKDKGQ